MDTARTLAAAFQNKLIRDFFFRDTITTHTAAFQDVMLGKFTGRPDWNCVDHAQEIAFELMKAVPAGQLAPMLALMGWLEWLKGHGSQAERYLRLAAQDVPGFRLAVLLRELIDRGYLADVATNPDTSYQRPTNQIRRTAGPDHPRVLLGPSRRLPPLRSAGRRSRWLRQSRHPANAQHPCLQ